MRQLTILAVAVFSLAFAQAQTTLTPGDLVVVSVRGDNPDDFRFIPLVDLAPNTEIIFTDKGYTNGGLYFLEGSLTFNSGTNTIPAGQNIGLTADPQYFTAGSFLSGTDSISLAGTGDQVIALQGTNQNDIVYIYAVQTNSTQFQSAGTPPSTTVSELPPGLTVGFSAVAVGMGTGSGDEWDNAFYTGPLALGSQTIAEFRANVSDNTNWGGSTSAYNPPTQDASFMTLSLGDNSVNNALGFYPNPATSTLHFELVGQEQAQVSIFNSIGQQVLVETVSSTLDITQLNPGAYVVRITSHDNTTTKRLLVR